MSSAPHTQEELTQLLQRVEERERTARRRAIFYSLVPIAVGALVLIVTTWQVYRAERDLATKKAELDFREKVIERLNPQRLPGGKVEGNTSARNEPTQQVSQVTRNYCEPKSTSFGRGGKREGECRWTSTVHNALMDSWKSRDVGPHS